MHIVADVVDKAAEVDAGIGGDNVVLRGTLEGVLEVSSKKLEWL